MKLSIMSLAAVALVAGCVSNTSPQMLANDPEGCTLKNYMQNGPWGRFTSKGSIAEYRTKANCAANRAAEHMAATAMQQRSNQMINFGNETPHN